MLRPARAAPVAVLLVMCYVALHGTTSTAEHTAPPQPTRGCAARTTAKGRVHGVVVDAGSTGTRAHVFTFTRPTAAAVWTLEDEAFIAHDRALGKHGAAAAIGPLVVSALRRLPRDVVGCVEVVLGATAGLRVLGATRASELIADARRVIEGTGMVVRSAEILSGTDEGVYAWTTVNYLVGAFEGTAVADPDGTIDAGTVGVLDGGGGSFQVVQEVPSSGHGGAAAATTAADAPAGFTQTVTLPFVRKPQRSAFTLRVFSALGFGLNSALAKFPDGGCEGYRACRAAGAAVLGPVTQRVYKGAGGVGGFYAFSYYHKVFGAMTGAVADIHARAEAVCGTDPRECAAAAYLSAVCEHVGMQSTARLTVAKKIPHGPQQQLMETAWPLGAFLTLSQRL